MEIGNKVLCMRTLIRSGSYEVVIKNKSYTILEINIDSENSSMSHIVTTSENGNKNWSFNDGETYFTFSRYFIDLKQERKLKLAKLNNNVYLCILK